MYLEKINKVGDVKKIPADHLNALSDEIRDFLIEKISHTGGHLGSNLGAVELTIALHLELNLPNDEIIWDVGHQSYTHKLLSGRKDGFDTLRMYHGMSGFPKRRESDCDSFDTGHSSTSISAGLGLVRARDLKGEKRTIVSVIGDGSLTGGLAFEALNNAGKLDSNFIIILNDNKMSISENVGGIPKYLNSIRTSEGYLDLKDDVYNKIVGTKAGDNIVRNIRRAKNSFKSLYSPGMMFEEMGVVYLGPINGHDIDAMRKALKEAKRLKRAVMIHVITEKGKGYEPAIRHPARFHGTGPFDIETGLPKKSSAVSWTNVFSTVMVKLGARNPKVCAITAAMPDGTGLKRFYNAYPERFFDVGIAEEHAVTFAAGLAAGGMIPVVAIYSSFLQRAYDQIIHDVCLQDLPVVFAVDRAGIVGNDGETHQGIFDLSYLSGIPGMTVMAPKNLWEFSDMLKFAVDFGHPIAVRYPRGPVYEGLEEFRSDIELGVSEWIYREEEIALLAVGTMVETAEKVKENLEKKGHKASLINARFVSPIDEEAVREALRCHKLIVTMEENVRSGGFGEKVLDFINSEKIRDKEINAQCLICSLPDGYIEHGDCALLKKENGIDADSVTAKILENIES
ncbi:MAG: 1-deoxy-D-xylulose-5-phosphate synthase [Lachnospiraceae bacterium]|nr:1-deoxy-D-xylulose-5-phosphate synthase [Lachnospiraceae bacterium]